MEHEEAKKLFSDYLEDELAPAQAEAVRQHLEQCAACRADFDSFRETMRSLSGLHRLDPPQEFVSKVERTIRRRSRGRFFGRETLLGRLPFEWISFAIILALLAVYLLTLLDQRITPADGQAVDAGVSDGVRSTEGDGRAR